MDELPTFPSLLGKSTLFDSNPSISDNNINIDNNDLHDIDNTTLTFTSSDGTVLPMKLKDNNYSNKSLSSAYETNTNATNTNVWQNDETYGININALLNKIENNSNASKAIIQKKKKTVSNTKQNKIEKLWVEKWRPKNFIHLVGNDKTNRRLLSWLRQWSNAVFNESQDVIQNNINNNNPFFIKTDDPFNRPNNKILLIHGPPGIGKTSIAHIMSKQLGYEVNEINASDERNFDSLKLKLQNCLFHDNLFSKPICLICDEIDGATDSGLIKLLINFINSDKRATSNLINFGNNKKLKLKNKNKNKLLLRPIIAICNNIYSPSLEKLKPYCEIIPFRKPSNNAILERLQLIIKKEKLNLPLSKLKEIIDISQGDIRNCINNLQFSSNLSNNENEIKDTNILTINKDFNKSWFKSVNSIFRKDPHKDNKQQFIELMKELSISGNFDKIIQGCFLLYPFVKYSDNGITKPANLSDWLYFHDRCQSSLFDINTTGGDLLRYSTILPLYFWQNFSDIANRDDQLITNPDFTVYELQNFTKNICQIIKDRLIINSSNELTFQNKLIIQITEILPYLDQILSIDVTKIKDLNKKQLIYETLTNLLDFYKIDIKSNYKDLKQSEIPLIKDTNLVKKTYNNQNSNSDFNNNKNNDTGKYILTLDPPIDEIVIFNEKEKKNTITKRPINYNLLLAKYEESKIKKKHLLNSKETSLLYKKRKLEQNDDNTKDNETFNDNNNKVLKKKSTIDFFKSQYSKISTTNNSNKNGKEQQQPVSISENNNNKKKSHLRIWVKYKEGYSNAVKKNISWESLWE